MYKDVQNRISEGDAFREKNNIEEALLSYSRAFDLLIDKAGVYAREKESLAADMVELRRHTDELFLHSRDFLRRTIDAASILNMMGVLFLEKGDTANARQKFEEAIDFIPEGVVYEDPEENLKVVAQKEAERSFLERIDEGFL